MEELLKATLKDGQPRQLSCNTQADASRGVGWAYGVIAGNTPMVYAAMMEGDRAFPGRMMAERLAGAFKKAGLQEDLDLELNTAKEALNYTGQPPHPHPAS